MVFDLLSSPDVAHLRKIAFDKVIATRKPVRVRDEREGRSYDSHWYPILDAHDEVIQVAVFATDITERRLLDQERLKVAKLESTARFASGIAHDFNNLISGILGYIELAQGLEEPASELYEYLEESKRSCLEAKELTKRFMTFSAVEDSQKKIGSIERIIMDSTTRVLADSRISYEFSISRDLWMVEFDEKQMGQIITILVSNAMEAMPNGGKISISAANMSISDGSTLQNLPLKSGDYVRISVQDQGIGIPEEHLPGLFDPYFSTKERGADKGMGLGLSHAFSMIKQHGGYIFIESKVGSGTTASLYFPRST